MPKSTVLPLLVAAMILACAPKPLQVSSDTVGAGDAYEADASADVSEVSSEALAEPVADVPVEAAPEAVAEVAPETDQDVAGETVSETTPDVVDDDACTPDCAGKNCGDDGCGGTCGPCGEDGDLCTGVWACVEGTCSLAIPPVTCQAKDTCHVAGVCDPLTGLCSDPEKCSSELTCVDGQCCACTEGACCDGCSFLSSTTVCDTEAAPEYVCKDGAGCGQDVYKRTHSRLCSGTGAACDGDLLGVVEAVADDCAPTEACVVGVATCQASAACLPATPGFVKLEAGSFWMGSPGGEACPAAYPGAGCPASGTAAEELGHNANETLHYVTLTHAFEIQALEVTQAEWQAAFGNNPSWFGPSGDGVACGGDCPVERVSWYDAAAYANKLSAKAGLAPCYVLTNCAGTVGDGCGPGEYQCGGSYVCDVALNGVATPYECSGYRLPTEAEWEYAYRAGSVTAFYPSAGNDGAITEPDSSPVDPNLTQIGWYAGNALSTPHPGGDLKPNAWGLHDLAGNVWEWCWGYVVMYPAGTVADPTLDPAGDAGSAQLVRGGAWTDTAAYARGAFRGSFGADLRTPKAGFRLVRSL